LLYIPWNFEIKNNPDVEKYLGSFKEDLSKRPEVKTKRYEWYTLSRYASDYYNDFEKPKIIWPQIASIPSFTIDNNTNYFVLNSSYILTLDRKLKEYLNVNGVFWQLNYENKKMKGYLKKDHIDDFQKPIFSIAFFYLIRFL
jgi:hypothetical protein